MCVVLNSQGSKQRVGADETGERPPEAGETRRGNTEGERYRGDWLVTLCDRCACRSGWGEAGEGRKYELGCVV